MADAVSWTFAADRDDGGVTVDAINIDMPETRPGATLSLECEFWDTPPAANGGQLGTTAGMTLGTATGATLGGSQAPYRDRYLDVRRYARFAGRASTNQTIDGSVRYRERLPTDADVDHIVVAIRPSNDLKNEATPGLWVLLTGATDQTRYIQDLARLTLDASVLGTLSEYPTRAELEADLTT